MNNRKGDNIDNIDDFGDTTSHCLESIHTHLHACSFIEVVKWLTFFGEFNLSSLLAMAARQCADRRAVARI